MLEIAMCTWIDLGCGDSFEDLYLLEGDHIRVLIEDGTKE